MAFFLGMPPKTKSQKAAQQNLAKDQENLSEQHTEAATTALFQDIKNQLQGTLQKNDSLEEQLAEKTALCEQLICQLQKSQKQCSAIDAHLQIAQSKHQALYHELRMQRQTTKHGLHKQELLEEQVELLKSADHSNTKKLYNDSANSTKAIQTLLQVNENLCSQLSDSLTIWTGRIADTKEKLVSTGSKLKRLQKERTALKKSQTQENA